MPKLVSLVVPTAPSIGVQKLGHPVPLSYFVVEENRSSSQPAQAKLPRRFSCSSALVNGRSVALMRSTANCSGVKSLRHSASVCVTSKVSLRAAASHCGAIDAAAKPTAVSIRRQRLVIMVSSSQFSFPSWLPTLKTTYFTQPLNLAEINDPH